MINSKFIVVFGIAIPYLINTQSIQ